jgi:hypothetical protein
LHRLWGPLPHLKWIFDSGMETDPRFTAVISRIMKLMAFVLPHDRKLAMRLAIIALFLSASAALAHAQADYSVHFEMEKPQYLLGEPIFCRFVIRNTGTKVFTFRYRTPTRIVGTDNDQEPRFTVRDLHGQRLPDPGRRPCGSAQGTAIYGSVTLPPGQTHTELWLLNQWASFSAPGHYHAHAERRLALWEPGPQVGDISGKALAFALAIDDLDIFVVRSTPAQIEAAYQPYLAAVKNPKDPNLAGAVVVLTSLPQPFFLPQLCAMADPGHPDRWDRRDVLDGLARLNTPTSWHEILKRFQEPDAPAPEGSADPSANPEDPFRSYALLLLAEKSDPAFIPPIIAILSKSQEPLRGEILRALGFFHDARASQVLFDNLHSPQVTDRMNAVLGLKTLGGKEVIPALIASLDDPELQVRQVVNFALEGLTAHKVADSLPVSANDVQHLAEQWRAWWLKSAESFSPPRIAPCHDW